MFFFKSIVTLVTILLTPLWFALYFVQFSSHPTESSKRVDALVVLGASVISNAIPSSVLKKRLDKAVLVYVEYSPKQVIVSGSGEELTYNEPRVMAEYLSKNGIPDNKIIQDPSGNRTYDTCWRLKNIYNIKSAIIISQEFHLPRANFICSSMGIQSTLISSESSSLFVTVKGTAREYPSLLMNIVLVLTNPTP